MIENHVVPNGKRWDVERDGTFTGAFAHEVNTAIGVATAAAQREQHDGVSFIVSVQQADNRFERSGPNAKKKPGGFLHRV
jgi:hypothetical protein